MTYDVEMAKLFKSREHKTQNNILVGTVVAVTPLKISIYDGNGYLFKEDLLMASRLRNAHLIKEISASSVEFLGASTTVTGESLKLEEVELTYDDQLFEVGEQLLIACDVGNQFFYVIDKLIGVE